MNNPEIFFWKCETFTWFPLSYRQAVFDPILWLSLNRFELCTHFRPIILKQHLIAKTTIFRVSRFGANLLWTLIIKFHNSFACFAYKNYKYCDKVYILQTFRNLGWSESVWPNCFSILLCWTFLLYSNATSSYTCFCYFFGRL